MVWYTTDNSAPIFYLLDSESVTAVSSFPDSDDDASQSDLTEQEN